MCTVTARSGGKRSTPRPQWGRLYVRVSSVLAALALVESVVSPGPFETALGCGLVVAGIGAIAAWTRRNCVALDQQLAERVDDRLLDDRQIEERASHSGTS